MSVSSLAVFNLIHSQKCSCDLLLLLPIKLIPTMQRVCCSLLFQFTHIQEAFEAEFIYSTTAVCMYIRIRR